MCRRKMVSTRIADIRKHFGKTCMPFLSRKSIKWFSMLSEELYAEQKMSLLEVCPTRECCHREQQVLKSWYKLQSRTARIWGKSTLFFRRFFVFLRVYEGTWPRCGKSGLLATISRPARFALLESGQRMQHSPSEQPKSIV